MLWWFALAMAQDVDVLLADAEQLLSGPPGCWEVVAKARWDHDLGPFGETRGGAVFVGRLQDGVWAGMEVLPTGEVTPSPVGVPRRIYDATARFTPVIGGRRGLWIRVKDGELQVSDVPDGEAEPAQLVRDALERMEAGIETAWAEPAADGGVDVQRTLALGPRREAVIVHHFLPEGPGPVSTDISVPQPMSVGFPPVRIHTAELSLRGQPRGEVLLPRAEALSTSFGLLGLRVTARQSVDYLHWSPCAAEESR